MTFPNAVRVCLSVMSAALALTMSRATAGTAQDYTTATGMQVETDASKLLSRSRSSSAAPTIGARETDASKLFSHSRSSSASSPIGERETDFGVKPLVRPGEGKSLRYRRALWELNDEYDRGDLTGTEYIQRKRKIENLYD
ncbi:MAG: hypothetical protein P9L88_02190 [Candidatus Tantalella remota]|nr:hypothetical protein [Candidatus Tantalella remota]